MLAPRKHAVSFSDHSPIVDRYGRICGAGRTLPTPVRTCHPPTPRVCSAAACSRSASMAPAGP